MHARRAARDAWFPSQEDDAFFLPDRGDVVFRDHAAARRFAERLARGGRGGVHVGAAELAAMALVHEVLHAVVERYREQHPGSFARLSAELDASLGARARRAVVDFLAAFPPPSLYHALKAGDAEAPARHLDRLGTGARSELAEELLLLWVTNQNAAYAPVRDVVGDGELGEPYAAFVDRARRHFDEEPVFGPRGETLVDLLLAPSRAHPDSIFDQLEYIERSWARAFGLDALTLWRRRLALQDLRAEEGRWFARGGPGPGEPLLEAMQFGHQRAGDEPARFSPDTGWMPNVVLVAKSVYVWLDQLTRAYGRSIHRLDQIPDEELDTLARRGFNALWLIGIFERSRASRKIKQMRGDRDALASAYSLASYGIAEELGGTAAYENLSARAWARGIRLAADMVPNHVGIDGDWVIDHPDWFLQTRTPPFPGYRFGGPDLSDDERVGVFLEEGYWSKTDAAVVFRRHDRWTGEDRFIYHGNDGTSMPWNDTAQLDYLRADVRRAVIETILHVARMFPIIRFDAAMTLAKRHIQRLWFPLPGEGGAIPSRADHSMTEEEFDRAMPVEFWREVVDTVAERAPGTLLLAEAFWMMEGYFVRTLGMHRVYNSAFMNMLKREENDKYRATIKNVLDFDPRILKRFVNFMNNPDEETAVAQFGDGDKYFGVCVLMCTMPGLPMFGHGQLEGLREKYGMEYRRPRWDERPNEGLVARHEREIVPLLHKRYLFSEVESFALYDFVTDGGEIDEDVYAYSNRAGEERALVVFVNKYKSTRGHLRRSTHRGDLASELGIDPGRGEWLVVRDLTSGLEHLRASREIVDSGISWELHAYEHHVFTGFRPVTATTERPYDRLAAELAGGGVPDVEAAVRRVYLRPVHAPLREALSAGHLGYLAAELAALGSKGGVAPSSADLGAARVALRERLGHVADGLDWMLTQRAGEGVAVAREPALKRAEELLASLARAVTDARREPSTERAPDEGDAGGARGEDDQGPPAAELLPRSSVEALLAWIQLEATLDLLAAPRRAAAEADAASAASAEPAACEADGDAAAEPAAVEAEAAADAGDAIDADRGEGAAAQAFAAAADVDEAAPPSTRAEREALLAEWELATPVVEAFTTGSDAAEARRRAALVVLVATSTVGAVGPAVRLALGTPRGRAFLGVHESGGVLWLIKERIEELARALADREAALGATTLAAAVAEADAVRELARREGYRAERIAAALGPPPSADAPLSRGPASGAPLSRGPAPGAPAEDPGELSS